MRARDKRRLDDLLREMAAKRSTMLGYPLNMDIRVTGYVVPFLNYLVNNLGDPFADGAYLLNSFSFERDVVNFFARLYHLPAAAAWGYVTGGGSEGNLCGLALGRQRFPDAVVYHSDRSHYSVDKAARLMGGDRVVLATGRNHRMKLGDLRRRLDRSRPAVVSVNVGTTMAGAVDDVAGVAGVLAAAGVPFHLHVDAALAGLVLPFLPGAPVFDFRLPISSVAVSGHKMLGCPLPCGLLVARRGLVECREVEYTRSNDATMGGSRSGLAVLAMWAAIKEAGTGGLRDTARRCARTSGYLRRALAAAGWPAWRHAHANTVLLARPGDDVCRRWQLAVEGDLAHVVVMPHVTRSVVDRFVADLLSTGRVQCPDEESTPAAAVPS